MALVAMLVLACNILGRAGNDGQVRIPVLDTAGVIAVGMQPGDGPPSQSRHHPVERKKPRQFELAVASQLKLPRAAHPSSAGTAWIPDSEVPAPEILSAIRIADTGQLPPAAADARRLRLHPGQAPPSA